MSDRLAPPFAADPNRLCCLRFLAVLDDNATSIKKTCRCLRAPNDRRDTVVRIDLADKGRAAPVVSRSAARFDLCHRNSPLARRVGPHDRTVMRCRRRSTRCLRAILSLAWRARDQARIFKERLRPRRRKKQKARGTLQCARAWDVTGCGRGLVHTLPREPGLSAGAIHAAKHRDGMESMRGPCLQQSLGGRDVLSGRARECLARDAMASRSWLAAAWADKHDPKHSGLNRRSS